MGGQPASSTDGRKQLFGACFSIQRRRMDGRLFSNSSQLFSNSELPQACSLCRNGRATRRHLRAVSSFGPGKRSHSQKFTNPLPQCLLGHNGRSVERQQPLHEQLAVACNSWSSRERNWNGSRGRGEGWGAQNTGAKLFYFCKIKIENA